MLWLVVCNKNTLKNMSSSVGIIYTTNRCLENFQWLRGWLPSVHREYVWGIWIKPSLAPNHTIVKDDVFWDELDEYLYEII